MESQNQAPNIDINPYGYWRLLQDDPDKRRKVYLELDMQSLEDLHQELVRFHVELSDLKHLVSKAPQAHASAQGSRVRCVITSSTQSLLRLLMGSRQITSARVDLREYAMQSACRPEY